LVLYGLSAYLATPIDKRKGRLRFVVISCVILATSTIDTLTDVRACFRVLYNGGPTGQLYAQAYDNVYVWDKDQNARIAGNAMLCITIAVGDALMVCPSTQGAFIPLTLMSLPSDLAVLRSVEG
jgi:hypothetical protein